MCRRIKRLTGMWAPMAARALMQNGARNTMKDMNNKAAAIMDSLDCSCERDAPIWPVVTWNNQFRQTQARFVWVKTTIL